MPNESRVVSDCGSSMLAGIALCRIRTGNSKMACNPKSRICGLVLTNGQAILTALILFTALPKSSPAGTWASFVNAPPIGVNHAMVLSDGSIYTDNGDGNC